MSSDKAATETLNFHQRIFIVGLFLGGHMVKCGMPNITLEHARSECEVIKRQNPGYHVRVVAYALDEKNYVEACGEVDAGAFVVQCECGKHRQADRPCGYEHDRSKMS